MPIQERDEVLLREPILAQKKVKARINIAMPADWKPKDAVKKLEGGDLIKDSYKACKLTVTITDDSVKTEHADAIPKSTIEDQFNVQKYPYYDKKKDALGWMNRQKLFQIEAAFGFDPQFVDRDGNQVEAFITRTGNKVAPKGEGIARVLNQDFLAAYFYDDMTVNPTNWVDKEILVDVAVEESEQYGAKNTITGYHKVEMI